MKRKGPNLSLSLQADFGKYDTLIKYTLVPSIPHSIIAILCINPNTWVLSEIRHFYIGIGFLVNALIDLLHVVISITYMNEFLFFQCILVG